MQRRDFLKLSALAIPGLSFARERQDRNCIVIQLTGGPSQLDTWDMKPDAPSHIRGPFRPIRTNAPGIEISELFPRMARYADRYSLIRSFTNDTEPTHEAWSPASLVPNAVEALDFRDAVRLVAIGKQFVTVPMFDTRYDDITWDAHGWSPFSTLAHYRDHVAPAFDVEFTKMLDALQWCSLVESTLVLVLGEFGRTPYINPSGGRDHWPRCQTVLIAGGGIPGGQVFGSSDAIGAEPRDHPVTPAMLQALIHT